MLVLENGSGDDLTDLAPAFGEAVEWHESAINLGFGGGQNRLARATGSRYLCFVNPDVVMPAAADAFGLLVRACADPGVAVAGPCSWGPTAPRSGGTTASFTGCAPGFERRW